MKMSFDDRVRKLNAVYSKVKFTEEDIDDYQWEAIETILREPRFALFIDTGLGKTVIMLFVIRNLIFSGEISKVLVIAPLKVSSRDDTFNGAMTSTLLISPLNIRLRMTKSIITVLPRPVSMNNAKRGSRRIVSIASH